ncbi:MAG: hypothetical protein P9M03_04000 [Candidatus Theseobacter exili]|nr:hypothetical protein [Candidatus Theseobacter exili]
MRKFVNILVLLVGVVIVLGWSALSNGESFNPGIDYDVYYEVGTFEIDTLERIRITNVITIGDREFIAFQTATSGLGSKDRTGYILMDAIRAIIPSDYSKPRRAFAPV